MFFFVVKLFKSVVHIRLFRGYLRRYLVVRKSWLMIIPFGARAESVNAARTPSGMIPTLEVPILVNKSSATSVLVLLSESTSPPWRIIIVPVAKVMLMSVPSYFVIESWELVAPNDGVSIVFAAERALLIFPVRNTPSTWSIALVWLRPADSKIV